MKRFRWAIVGTGAVARKFAQGLGYTDGGEAALVVSRSEERARQFAHDLGMARATGSLDAALADDAVDAFYIATPASAHRDHALLCLSAGRPVLVEKPFALDADQAQEVAAAARARSVFCMEAMWTRFLPLVARVRRLIADGAIGEVRTVAASFGIAESRSPAKALYDPARGGGALLHRGVYPVSLAIQLLGPPDRVHGDAVIGETGIDEEVAAIFSYRRGAQAVLRASLRTSSANGFTIEGTRGRIDIHAPIYCPFRLTLTPYRARSGEPAVRAEFAALGDSPRFRGLYQRFGWLAAPLRDRRNRRITVPYAGNGYQYEAEEAMRCIRAGRGESTVMPLSESVAVMQAIDAIRAGWRPAPARRPAGPEEPRLRRQA